MWMRIYHEGVYTHYWAGVNPQLVDVYISPGDSLRFYVGSDHDCITNELLFTFNGDTIFEGDAGEPDPAFTFVTSDTGHYYLRYFHYFFNFYLRV